MLTSAQNAWNTIETLFLLEEARKSGRDVLDNIAIQKLTFLSELAGKRKNLKTSYYKFFRYNNGPYSKVLANDISHLEKYGFVDSETRKLTDRGKYLLEYARPEVNLSENAILAETIIRTVVDRWKDYRGWSIVDAVYELKVPVADRDNEEIRVSEIPMCIDIFVPEMSSERDVLPFSDRMISNIQNELNIAPSALDPNSEEFQSSVNAMLERALAAAPMQ